MLPVSTSTTVRFTPPGHEDDANPPVYLIRPASYLERSRWRQDLAAEGARYASDNDLLDALAEAIDAMVEESGRAALHEILTQARASNLPDGPEIDPDVVSDLKEIEERIGLKWGPYRRLGAERQLWSDLAPFFAAKRFVMGWENVDGVPFARRADGVPDELLEALPRSDMASVGWSAVSMFMLSEAQRKNLPSPSLSTSNPPLSAEAPSPSTASDGISPVTDMNGTHA